MSKGFLALIVAMVFGLWFLGVDEFSISTGGRVAYGGFVLNGSVAWCTRWVPGY